MKFPVLWLSFPLAKMWPAWHDVSKKRLVVYEAMYAKTATSQKKELCGVLDDVDVDENLLYGCDTDNSMLQKPWQPFCTILHVSHNYDC